MEWWYNNSGQNLLKGVEGDLTNPPRLPAATIVQFLRTIPDSRLSFNRVVGTMLEDEQLRLQGLAESAMYLVPDYKIVEDMFQASQNKVGVRTAGLYGGTRRGGNN